MIKNILLTTIFIFASLFSSAQKIKEKDRQQHQRLNEQNDSAVLKMALQIKDYDVALNAAYRLTAMKPNDNENLLSLAEIYYKAEKFDQSIALCDKVLMKDSNNVKAIEIMVANFSKQENLIGLKMGYSELFKITNDGNYLYKLSEVYFNKKEYQNALNVLSKLVSDTTIKASTIALGFTKNNQTAEQSVPVLAAAYNLIGYTYLINQNPNESIKFFQKAIAIKNDFELALNNLNAAKKIIQQKPVVDGKKE
jgi:tetratricopeptide (TPR) repeat protein